MENALRNFNLGLVTLLLINRLVLIMLQIIFRQRIYEIAWINHFAQHI